MSTPHSELPTTAKPMVTYAIIASCVAAFLLQESDPRRWLTLGALWPLGEQFEPWQVLTYAFLHGGGMHLFFNMFGVHMFGGDIERVVGSARFAVLYFVSVITAALAQLAVNHVTGSIYPTVGASGGLFGLLLVFALLFPKRKMILLILPIPMPAWLFVTLYAGVELWMGVTGTMQGIAHFAHLGGLVGGAIVWFWWMARLPKSRG